MIRIGQPNKQSGIVTFLILIFLGLAVTVAVLSMVNSLRTSKEESITFRNQTLSQAKAWTAAEVLKEYLLKQVENDTTWAAFKAATAIPGELKFQGFDGVTTKLRLENPNTLSPRVVAEIIAKAMDGAREKSTTNLEVVYLIKPEGVQNSVSA